MSIHEKGYVQNYSYPMKNARFSAFVGRNGPVGVSEHINRTFHDTLSNFVSGQFGLITINQCLNSVVQTVAIYAIFYSGLGKGHDQNGPNIP